MVRARVLLVGWCVLCLPMLVEAGNWPAWRGAEGIGVSAETAAPLTWTQTENVKWKVALPDEGNATPIIWKDRVFIAQARDKGTVRGLMCFRRDDGELLWTREVKFEGDEPTHKTNPYCSSSPVTDGERVVVWYGSAGLYAYDFDGKELWHQDLGEFNHIWGNASSPVLYGDSVILNAGPGERSFLAAFDKRTGDELWRNDLERPTGESEKPQPRRRGWSGSWSTPVLQEIGGQTQLILSLPYELVAFDPADGKRLWWCDGLTQLVYTSPLVNSDTIVAMSGYGGAAIAVRTGGAGDTENLTGNVTETHRLWRHDKNPQRVGSGVLVGKHLYILHDTGVAWCLDTETGEKTWQARLSGSWTSMVHAAGRLYVIATNGTTYVLEPNPTECKILAENRLGETTRASMAFSDGQIFIRTYKHLYCIEDSQDTPKEAGGE